MKEVVISPLCFLKMKYLTFGTDEEVQAFIIGENKKYIYIEDLIVLEQEVSGASTEVDNKPIGKFINEQVKNGKQDIVERIIGTFHSHVNMGTFWSSEDEDNIVRLGNSIDCVVSIVSSKSNDEFKILCRLDLFRPFRATLDNVEYTIDYADYEKKIVNSKVKSLEDGVLTLSSGIKIRIHDIVMEDEKLKKWCEKQIEEKCKPEKIEWEPYEFNSFSKMMSGTKPMDLIEIDDGIFAEKRDVVKFTQLFKKAKRHFIRTKNTGKQMTLGFDSPYRREEEYVWSRHIY